MSKRRAALFVALAASLASCERETDTRIERSRAAILPVQADEPFPALGCYQGARDRTLLSQYDAFLLCRGATSAAPVACYERASREAILNYQAIALCRCANSTAPIECFERAQDQTTLGQNEIITLCNATAMRRLYPDCTPIARGGI